MTRVRPTRIGLFLVCVLGGCVLGAAALAVGMAPEWPAVPQERAVGQASAQPGSGSAADDLHYARSLSRAFQHAAAQVEQSVVHITTRSSRVAVDFFGRRVRRQASGLGSGVVVSADGYILTNNHVVDGATELLVRFADGREYAAELVGGDELRDIAVLKVDASGLRPARLGSSAELEVGEWVLALGSPFGFDRTVTAGIVSAKGRGLGIISDEFKDAEQFIQTDAAINPGNSGGPMINLEGEVVGINTAIFSRTGGSIGLGFSIPIELAQAVYTNIVNGGRVDFGWLGMEIAGDEEGVRVARVLEGGPAARSGLRAGDVVRRYQGRPVRDATQLIRSIQFTPPGSEAELEVERDGRPVRVRATIASRLEAEIERYGGREIEPLGIIAMTATEEAAGADVEGVFVLDVTPGGPAAGAGMFRGDVILGVDRRRVRTVEELRDRLRDAGREVRIDLRRGDRVGYTVLRR